MEALNPFGVLALNSRRGFVDRDLPGPVNVREILARRDCANNIGRAIRATGKKGKREVLSDMGATLITFGIQQGPDTDTKI
jgi:hypothetical protein